MSQARQLALLWASVAVALVALSPWASSLLAALPGCPVRAWLDLPCVSCGATRAALALARLDLLAALAFNPLLALAGVGLVGGGLAAGGLAALGRPLPRFACRPTAALRLTAAAALLLNWVYLLLADI